MWKINEENSNFEYNQNSNGSALFMWYMSEHSEIRIDNIQGYRGNFFVAFRHLSKTQAMELGELFHQNFKIN